MVRDVVIMAICGCQSCMKGDIVSGHVPECRSRRGQRARQAVGRKAREEEEDEKCKS